MFFKILWWSGVGNLLQDNFWIFEGFETIFVVWFSLEIIFEGTSIYFEIIWERRFLEDSPDFCFQKLSSKALGGFTKYDIELDFNPKTIPKLESNAKLT